MEMILPVLPCCCLTEASSVKSSLVSRSCSTWLTILSSTFMWRLLPVKYKTCINISVISNFKGFYLLNLCNDNCQDWWLKTKLHWQSASPFLTPLRVEVGNQSCLLNGFDILMGMNGKWRDMNIFQNENTRSYITKGDKQHCRVLCYSKISDMSFKLLL